MELEHLEPILRAHGEDIATIKAKLFNGLTSDIAEIKEILKNQNTAFINYQKTREETCPLNRRTEKRGASTARLMGVIFGTNGAILGITMLVLKLTGVV